MMRWLVALGLLAAPPAWPQDAPDSSVIVTIEPARHGSLPVQVLAYGTAAPAIGGGLALSMPQEGRIAAILVTPGERVARGAALLRFDLSAAGVSQYRQAETALTLAQTQRRHTQDLLRERLATRDQLAQADKAVSDAASALEALRREGADQTRRILAAPFDGIVETVPVAQGDRVAPNAPLATLTRLDGLVVTVGVEPGLAATVAPGDAVALTHLAASGVAAPFAGRVLRVDGALNPKTRLIDVDIGVPPGRVISGEGFRAAITTAQPQGWIVPHDAVLGTGDAEYLFQANGAKAARVAVRVLTTAGDRDLVDGALVATRPVIVEGGTQLDDGDPIRTGP